MNKTRSHHIIEFEGSTRRAYEEELIGEEPLLIRIENQPYSVVMRTPGEEIFHTAGFCLTEGLIDTRNDLATIDYCDEIDSNVVTVRLHQERVKKVSTLLERRGFVSQTSCGICGKEMIKDLFHFLTTIRDEVRIEIDNAIECVDRLTQYQDLYKRTFSSHAAILYDSQTEVLAMAEDVGRHNALDKVIGKVLMNGQLGKAGLAVLSSRISYELVQKAARAHLPILVSLSRPTSLAVELGESLNMTLACMRKGSGLLIFCGEERLVNA